jgi:hypothetical protein
MTHTIESDRSGKAAGGRAGKAAPHARESKRRPRRGRRWWQWLLVYPSFGVAAITAAPALADRALAVYHDTNTETFSEALEQASMWDKNAACPAAGLLTSLGDSSRLNKVDTAACPSGDLLVRALTADRRSVYRWVAYDDIVRPIVPGGGLVPAARAAPGPAAGGARAGGGGRPQLAMQAVQLICQRKADARTLVRRVKTAGGCFDEYVDIYSGVVTARRSVPCTPSC